MKPFRAQCNEVARRAFTRRVWNKKKQEVEDRETKTVMCEEQIWFEPSLEAGVFIGKCKHETHNPVYRKVA